MVHLVFKVVTKTPPPRHYGCARCAIEIRIAFLLQNLPAPEREKYERKAREEKARAGPSGGSSMGVRHDRLDNTGQLISVRTTELCPVHTCDFHVLATKWHERGRDYPSRLSIISVDDRFPG